MLGWLKECRGFDLNNPGRDNIITGEDDGMLYSTLADVKVDNPKCLGGTDVSECSCQRSVGAIQMPDGWQYLADPSVTPLSSLPQDRLSKFQNLTY